MRKQSYRFFAMLMLVFLLVQPLTAFAAETVDVDRECSLELEYSSNGTFFPDLTIKLYRIAEMRADGTCSLTAPYNTLPVKIQGITSQKEWRDTANTLAAYIASQQLSPAQSATTTDEGIASFTKLDTGIYLVMGASAKTDTHTYHFENFCVFLPRPQKNGTQLYDLTAKPKFTVSENPDEPKDVTYQVLKLWKDSGIQSARPANVTVDILKNQVFQETVKLNADNNWTYSWTVQESGDVWQVVEKDVPDAYTVVITNSGTVFTITNSRPAPGGNPPKTGDSFSLRPWLIAFALSGMLLMVLGLLQKRNRR